MYVSSTCVESAGPPPVISSTEVNTLNPPMTSITVTNSSAGRTAGSVTARKRCQAPAPSISAASNSSLDTPCSAARKMTIDQPTPFHTPSAETATIPVQRPASHEVGCEVTCVTSCSIQLTRPLSANRYWNSSETSNQLVTTGR